MAMDDQRVIPDSEDQQGAMDEQLERKKQGNVGGQFLQTSAEEAPCLLVSKAAFPLLKGLEGMKSEVVGGVRPLNAFGGKAERLQERIREEARRSRKDRKAAGEEAVKEVTDTFVQKHVDTKEPVRGKEEAATLPENVGKRRKLESKALKNDPQAESSSKLAPLGSPFGAYQHFRPAFEGGGLAGAIRAAKLSGDKGLLNTKLQGPQKPLDEQGIEGQASQMQERKPFGVQQPELTYKAGDSKAVLGGAVNVAASSQGLLGRKRSSYEVEKGELKDSVELQDRAEVQQVHRLRMETLGAMKEERLERSEGKRLIKEEVAPRPEGKEEQGIQRMGERERKGLRNMIPLISDSVRRATAGLDIANERHERRRVAAEAAEKRANAVGQKATELECGALGGVQSLPAGEIEASSDEDVPLGRKRSKVLRDKIRKRSLLGAFEIAGSEEALLPNDAGLPLVSPGLARPERVSLEDAAAAKSLLAIRGGQASGGLGVHTKAGEARKNDSVQKVAQGTGVLLGGKKEWPGKGRLIERSPVKMESQLQEAGEGSKEENGAIELSGREALALQSLRARGLLETDSTMWTRKPLQQQPLLEAGVQMDSRSLANSVLQGFTEGVETRLFERTGLCMDGCSLGFAGEGGSGSGDCFADFETQIVRRRRRADRGRLQLEAKDGLGFEELDFKKESAQLQDDLMLKSQQPEALVLPSQSRSTFGSQIRGDFSYEVVGFVSKIGGWALYLVAGACATRGETKLSDVCCKSRRQFLEARAAVDYQAKSVSGLELTQLTESRLRKQAWRASNKGEVYVVRRLAGRRMRDSEQAALGCACKLLEESEGGGASQGTEGPPIVEDSDMGVAEAEERCPPNELEVIYEVPQDKSRPRFQRFRKGELLQATAFAVRVEKWLHDPRCSICQDDIESVSVLCQTEQCGHVFHRGCLLNWLESSNSCPTCRTRIPTFEGAAIAHKDLTASFDDGLPADEFADIMCEVCSLDESAEEAGNCILICDNCNKGYHLWCIGLDKVPDGDWYCAPCQATFLAACALLEQPRLAPQNAQRQNRRAAQRRAPRRPPPRLGNRGAQLFGHPNLQEGLSEREDGRGGSSPDLGEDGLSPFRRSSRLADLRLAREVSPNLGLQSPLSEGVPPRERRQRRPAAVQSENDGGVLSGFSHEFSPQGVRLQQQEGDQPAGLWLFYKRIEPSRPTVSEHDELLPASPQRARRRMRDPVFGPQAPKPCATCKRNKKGGMHCLRRHGEHGGPEEQGRASG